MKNLKEQKPNAEVMKAVDVELNEEQLDVVAGGIVDRGDGTGCTDPFNKFTKFMDIILPPAPVDDLYSI
jgi:hypothetical protein